MINLLCTWLFFPLYPFGVSFCCTRNYWNTKITKVNNWKSVCETYYLQLYFGPPSKFWNNCTLKPEHAYKTPNFYQNVVLHINWIDIYIWVRGHRHSMWATLVEYRLNSVDIINNELAVSHYQSTPYLISEIGCHILSLLFLYLISSLVKRFCRMKFTVGQCLEELPVQICWLLPRKSCRRWEWGSAARTSGSEGFWRVYHT